MQLSALTLFFPLSECRRDHKEEPMKRAVFLLALGLPLGHAYADCKGELAQVDQMSAKIEQTDDMRRALRSLREAAAVAGERGNDQLCETIASNMKNMLEKQREANQQARDQARKAEYLTSAKAMPEIGGIARASRINGSPVRNLAGEDLGTIEEVAIDASTGQVAYVVLVHGGFLGLGEKRFAIPWQALQRTSDREVYVLAVDKATLDKAKGFDDKAWPLQADTTLVK
jgi:sporulation protein YlmC with PRC-barrel domain